MADEGKLINHRTISAKELWKKMLRSLFETGHPWMTFKDNSNFRYSNSHAGIVHSSNLCTEIFLHTKPSKYKHGNKTEVGETAVCNLSSVNLKEHLLHSLRRRIEELFWTDLESTTFESSLSQLRHFIYFNLVINWKFQIITRFKEKKNLLFLFLNLVYLIA